MDRASDNMAIIIQQDPTEYSLFKSVYFSTCFGWYITHRQELITLYVQYLALMRPVLLYSTCPERGWTSSRPATFTTGSSTGLNSKHRDKPGTKSRRYKGFLFGRHQGIQTCTNFYCQLSGSWLPAMTYI